MPVRRSLAPVAILFALLSLLALPGTAHAAGTQVTVTVTGVQTYGGQPTFSGTTGVAGVTVSGMTCTGLTGGTPIAPTLAALGTYTIDGSTCSGGVLSNQSYTISGYSGGRLTVNRAALTVTAENKTRQYGDANPPLTYTVAGFVNGEGSSVLSGSPNLSTNATTTSAPGDYTISVSKGSLTATANNYVVNTFVPGKLTVQQKQVTISVTGAQTYGGPPTFTATTGVSGVTVSNVTCAKLSDGTPIAPTLAASGSYTIDGATCTGDVASGPNYTIGGWSGGKLTVNRAALTVTADDKTRQYGDPNPSFTYTVTGFVNGEDSSVLTGSPNLGSSATVNSAPGDYPISILRGSLAAPAGNYVLNTFVPGKLTVQQKQVTISVTGVQTYGGQPTFTATTGVSGLTVTHVSCTKLSDGTPIAPTLQALGSYTIDGATCTGDVPSSPNYTVAGWAGGKLTVNRAALTVTADDKTRDYGDPNPGFTYTVTGFVNGEDASVLTGSPNLGTSATAGSVPGDYPIAILKGSLAAPAGNYVLNTFVAGTLTVSPKPVAVAVTGAQTYGGAPLFAGSTGVAGLTVSGVSCAKLADGRAVAPDLPVADDYAIDPASCTGGVLSSTNYTIGSYTPATLDVSKAALTVTADDEHRTYGFANPPLGYAITGYQNGEDASVVSGAPTLSTTAVVKSDAGSYPIDIAAGTLSAANYRFVLVPGTFTIDKRQLTVAADPATRGYGEADPAFSASYTGFRNGDTAADLTGSPAFSTSATAASPPGAYPLDVAVGTLASPNYAFTGFTSSTLTIVPTTPAMTTKKMRNGVLSATLTFGTAHTPVAGATVTFTVGNGTNLACTAVTDASGTAECTASGLDRTLIQLAGYTAHFAGSPGLLPVDRHQGIL
ncbi:MBG domain-containing protein [Nocardioides panacisoli]|uniref:MBG domain-containing protein n=1 Tax=Nocardioides panacisoli TaxID=627624 RepID=A0ABP7J351_9ACTN